MNIIARIRRRIQNSKRNRSLFKKFADRGGYMDRRIKLSVTGIFEFGEKVTIHCDGIDNVSRSQIVILPDAKLSIGNNVGMSRNHLLLRLVI